MIVLSFKTRHRASFDAIKVTENGGERKRERGRIIDIEVGEGRFGAKKFLNVTPPFDLFQAR